MSTSSLKTRRRCRQQTWSTNTKEMPGCASGAAMLVAIPLRPKERSPPLHSGGNNGPVDPPRAQPMTTSNPVPDPVNKESRTPHPAAPPLAPAGAPQKQERDYLVIGLIVALMAMVVAGFFALDSKIDALETSLNGRIDALITRMDAMETTLNGRIDALITRVDSLETTLNGRIDALSARIDALSTRDGLETALNARIDGLYELMLSSPKA